MNYYLDIETTGLDELHDKIIITQYMELDRNTGNLPPLLEMIGSDGNVNVYKKR